MEKSTWKSVELLNFHELLVQSEGELPSGLSLMVRVPHHDPEHGRWIRVAVRPIRRAHGPEALEGQAPRPEEN